MKMLWVILACVPAVLAQSQESTKHLAGVSAPVVVHKVEASYTAEARQKGIEGTTILSAEIGTDGIPVNIRVVKPLDPGLDARTVQALKQWRFQPGKRDGRTVTVSATVQFSFRLSKFELVRDPPFETEEPVEDNDPVYPFWW